MARPHTARWRCSLSTTGMVLVSIVAILLAQVAAATESVLGVSLPSGSVLATSTQLPLTVGALLSFTPTCGAAATPPVSLHWTLADADGAWNPHALPTVAAAAARNATTWVLPTNVLPPGTYVLSVMAAAGSPAPGVACVVSAPASAQTTFAVRPAPPVVRMNRGGTRWLVPSSLPVIVNATASYDPNPSAPGGVPADVSCNWTCTVDATGTGVSVPCDSAPALAALPWTACAVTLPASALTNGSVVSLALTVSSASSSATHSVTVVAASDASVGVAIDIAKAFPTAARPLVPISQPLRLTSIVRPANGTAFVPGSVLSYFWSTPNATLLDLDSASVAPAGHTSLNLLIAPMQLAPGAVYVFRLDIVTQSPAGRGFAEIELTTNTPPSAGTLNVTPDTGILGTTTYTLVANGFVGDSLRYNFMVVPASGDPAYPLLPTPLSTPFAEIDFLPANISNLYAVAFDPFGDSARSSSVPTTVVLPANTSAAALAELLSKTVARAVSQGDAGAITNVVESVGQLVNAGGVLGLSAAADQQLRLAMAAALVQGVGLLPAIDADAAVAFILALRIVIYTAPTLSAALFATALPLLEPLAAQGAGAAVAFLDIASTMLRLNPGIAAGVNVITKSLELLTLSVLQDQVCDEPSAAATSDGLDWAASFQSDFANTTFSFEDGGSVRFGNLTNFDGTAAIDNSHCRKSQIVSQAMPPVAVPSDSLFAVANNTNYLTVSLFRPDGTPYPVRNLSDSQRIYFSQPMPDCDARDVTLLYWNTTFNDWDVRGVFRDDDLMPADNCTFVGYTLHLTTFAIGKLVVAINTVDPTQDAFLLEGLGSTRGSIMTLCVLLALIVTFFMCLYFTLRFDDRDTRMERVPTAADVNHFAQEYMRLYKMRVSRMILKTRCLSEWTKTFETKQQPEDKPASMWTRLRVHCKFGIRNSHAYVSLFYQPLATYTRTQRLVVLFSILFASMCTTALFYQFGEASSTISAESLLTRLVVGLLSSVIVFVPTTAMATILRRVRRRVDPLKLEPEQAAASTVQVTRSGSTRFLVTEDTVESLSKYDTATSPTSLAKDPSIELALIAKANPVEHVLLDWTLPWWAGIVVYVVVGVGWLLCFYTTILYGVKFTDDEADAWLSSFAISVVLSAVVLQSLRAIATGFLAVIVASTAVVATIAAFGLGTNVVAMAAGP